jgi:hypothetical protein
MQEITDLSDRLRAFIGKNQSRLKLMIHAGE